MILILSQKKDATTNDVIDWISYYGVPFKRLNGLDFYEKVEINFSGENEPPKINIENIDLNAAKVVWFRRWLSAQDLEQVYLSQKKENIDPIILQFNEYIRSELKALVTFFFDNIPKNKTFSRTKTDEINKLIVLKKAKEIGLKIPETIVVTCGKNLSNLINKQSIISKAISNSPSIRNNGEVYLSYTSLIKNSEIENEKRIAPSLFQQCINKKYEIRTFLLSGRAYSMAIFSQSDGQTAIDFREYNYNNPNRVVPYQLPKDIETKLFNLVNHFEIRTGSVDMIKTIEGDYIFLEINPGGQFGMVSYPCNYHLEKKLALELIKFGT